MKSYKRLIAIILSSIFLMQNIVEIQVVASVPSGVADPSASTGTGQSQADSGATTGGQAGVTPGGIPISDIASGLSASQITLIVVGASAIVIVLAIIAYKKGLISGKQLVTVVATTAAGGPIAGSAALGTAYAANGHTAEANAMRDVTNFVTRGQLLGQSDIKPIIEKLGKIPELGLEPAQIERFTKAMMISGNLDAALTAAGLTGIVNTIPADVLKQINAAIDQGKRFFTLEANEQARKEFIAQESAKVEKSLKSLSTITETVYGQNEKDAVNKFKSEFEAIRKEPVDFRKLAELSEKADTLYKKAFKEALQSKVNNTVDVINAIRENFVKTGKLTVKNGLNGFLDMEKQILNLKNEFAKSENVDIATLNNLAREAVEFHNSVAEATKSIIWGRVKPLPTAISLPVELRPTEPLRPVELPKTDVTHTTPTHPTIEPRPFTPKPPSTPPPAHLVPERPPVAGHVPATR